MNDAINRRIKAKGAKKTKLAVALEYKPKDDLDAPEVIASEQGIRADKLLEIAAKNKIPIHKDPNLAELLAAANIGDSIPPIAFIAVAEILRSLYSRLDLSADEKPAEPENKQIKDKQP